MGKAVNQGKRWPSASAEVVLALLAFKVRVAVMGGVQQRIV